VAAFDRSGSTFDSFLEEEGIWEKVKSAAVKRVSAWRLSREMRRQKKTNRAMARAARAMGKSLAIRIADRKPAAARRRRGACRSQERPA
jgi:hypothetical protein